MFRENSTSRMGLSMASLAVGSPVVIARRDGIDSCTTGFATDKLQHGDGGGLSWSSDEALWPARGWNGWSSNDLSLASKESGKTKNWGSPYAYSSGGSPSGSSTSVHSLLTNGGLGWTPWESGVDVRNEKVKEKYGTLKLGYSCLSPQHVEAPAARDYDRTFLSSTVTDFNVNLGGNLTAAEPQYYLPAPASPMLRVTPEKWVQYAKYWTRVLIEPVNVPEDLYVHESMIEAIVETPSGEQINCRIKRADEPDCNYEGSFLGIFKAVDEVGHYQLRVRLSLPMTLWSSGKFGVVGAVEQLPFVRNYYKESTSTSEGMKKASFQVDYVPFVGKEGNEADGNRMSNSKVWGITCYKYTNRLYYTDRTGNFVSCIDPEGRVIFKSPSNYTTGTGDLLSRPTGICCDEMHRRLIIADKDNHRVSFFSLDGQYISSFGAQGHANGSFNFPWDVAVNPAGDRIVVSDSRNKRLQMFDKFGNFIAKYSIYEQTPFDYKNELDYPRGVAFNSTGSHIYVTDFNANNILEIPVGFQYHRHILPSGKIYRPQGIAVDSVDCLLICDSRHKAVRHMFPGSDTTYSHNLSVVHQIGREALEYPLNVAVMGDDRIAVLDAESRIRIF